MPTADPGHRQSVHALYSDHHTWLQGWLRRRLGCSFDAADLMQDTFVRVLHRPDAAAIREPRSYLATIAHGLMVNHLRRKDLERAYLQALAAMPQDQWPSAERRAVLLETLDEIDALLAALPARVRRAFLLCQLEGLPHAEIAARLGVSVSSVRQYIARALRHCLAAA